MKSDLPVITIEGTEFKVDVMKEALIEVTDPNNIIPFNEMLYLGDGYGFSYDLQKKNLPGIMSASFVDITIPPMVKLDPDRIALKYNQDTNGIDGKTDFEIMIDQELYRHRLSGHLPIIDIMGLPFFVDVRMDSLRPKDDFSTPGIVYSEIDNYILPDDLRYWIPYHPLSHSIKEIDAEKVTTIPRDIFVIEIPTLEKLDPVGYARHHGFNVEQLVMANPIEKNMVAKIIPWQETGINQCIENNLLKRQQIIEKDNSCNPLKKSTRQRKGNRM